MFQRFLLRQYHKVYRYDNWMRRHFSFTGHLAVLVMLAAMVFGVDTKSSTTYQLFVFLAVLLLLALLNSCFNRLKVSAKRHLPRYGTVGEALSYTVELKNLTDRHYDRLALIERFQDELPSVEQLRKHYRLDAQPFLKRSISFRQWRKFLTYSRGGFI